MAGGVSPDPVAPFLVDQTAQFYTAQFNEQPISTSATGQLPRSPMAHPRFIYYNDAHHFHAKRIEPPASEHMLQWPEDEMAGTGADTLVLGLG